MAFGGNQGINIKLGLDASKFNEGLKSAGGVVEAFKSSVTSSMKGVDQAFGNLRFPTLVDGVQAAAGAFIEFDSAMRNINSIAQMGEKDFAAFSNTILHLNDTVNSAVGPAEAARAAYDIMSSGFENAAEAQKILQTAMIAGTAGMTDAAKAAQVITGVLNAYNMSAEEATHVNDVLFNAVKYGVVTYEQMATTFGRVAPTAAANGVELEELSAAVATLTVKGIRANEAVTGIKRALTAVAAPTAQARKTLEEYGITTDMVTQKLRDEGLVPALRMLLQATNEDKQALRELLGESTAINAAFALAGKDAGGAFERISAKIGEAGSAQEAFAQQSKSLKVQIEQMKAAAEGAGIVVGGLFAPAMSLGAGLAREVFEAITHTKEGFAAVKDMVSGIDFSMVALGMTGVVVSGGALIGLLATLSPAFAGWITTLGVATAAQNLAGSSAMFLASSLTKLITPWSLILALLVGVSTAAHNATEDWKNFVVETEAANVKGVQLNKTLRELAEWRAGGKTGKTKQEILEMEKAEIATLQAATIEASLIKGQADKAYKDLISAGKANTAEGKAAQKTFIEAASYFKQKQEAYLNAKKKWEESGDEKKGTDTKKENDEAEVIKNRAQKIKEYKLLKDKIADGDFKNHTEELRAIEEFKKKYVDSVNLMKAKKGELLFEEDDQDKEFNYQLMRDEREYRKKSEKETSEQHKRNFKINRKAERDELDAKWAANEINLQQYVAGLRGIGDKLAAENKNYNNEYKDDLANLNEHIAKTKQSHYDNEKKWARDHANEMYALKSKQIEREGKLGGSLEDQAKAYAKLAASSKFTNVQREEAANKAATKINAHFEEQRKADVRSLNAKKESTKVALKASEEEMELLKEKAAIGMVSESEYIASSKNILELKKQELALAEKAELVEASKGTNEEEKAALAAEIKNKYITERQSLEKNFVDQFSKNMDDIKKAKGEDIAMTEEQIKKQKEYFDLISNEGKGAVKSLDEFVKEMNVRFGSENMVEKGPMSQGRAEKTNTFGVNSPAALLRKREALKRQRGHTVGVNLPFSTNGVSAPGALDLSSYDKRIAERGAQEQKWLQLTANEAKQTNAWLAKIYNDRSTVTSLNAAKKGNYGNGSIPGK